MKRVLVYFFTAFSICLIVGGIYAGYISRNNKVSKGPFPKATHWVNDFDDILTTVQEVELDSICRNYQNETTNQLVVATIDSIQPYTNIEEYSVDMYNDWRLGTKEKNNGLLITVFPKLHKARITTGYGTEKILTNEICDGIMKNQMIPHFKNGEYYEGIKEAILKSIELWK